MHIDIYLDTHIPGEGYKIGIKYKNKSLYESFFTEIGLPAENPSLFTVNHAALIALHRFVASKFPVPDDFRDKPKVFVACGNRVAKKILSAQKDYSLVYLRIIKDIASRIVPMSNAGVDMSGAVRNQALDCVINADDALAEFAESPVMVSLAHRKDNPLIFDWVLRCNFRTSGGSLTLDKEWLSNSLATREAIAIIKVCTTTIFSPGRLPDKRILTLHGFSDGILNYQGVPSHFSGLMHAVSAGIDLEVSPEEIILLEGDTHDKYKTHIAFTNTPHIIDLDGYRLVFTRHAVEAFDRRVRDYQRASDAPYRLLTKAIGKKKLQKLDASDMAIVFKSIKHGKEAASTTEQVRLLVVGMAVVLVCKMQNGCAIVTTILSGKMPLK